MSVVRRWLRGDRQRASRHHPLSNEQRQAIWAVVCRVLDYPTTETVAALPTLRAVLADVPPSYADPLLGVLDRMAAMELRQLQEEYVQTFDHTRKCALYLTYFTYGDTRQRGIALVQFKQAYRLGGVEFAPEGLDEELPDHLCAVLSFGAQVDHDGAWKLLLDHRAGVEMLRLALERWDDGDGSLWAPALGALCATLPPLKGDEADALQRLIEAGPPAEEVGLQPYLLDPSLDAAYQPAAAPSGPVNLGMPHLLTTTGGDHR